MARGNSGRVVIEISPILKRELHARLALEGMTLKDWFITQAGHYLEQYERIRLVPLKEKSTIGKFHSKKSRNSSAKNRRP